MDEAASSPGAAYRDALTGLPTVAGWLTTLEHLEIPIAGGIIACAVLGVHGVIQAAGQAAGDAVLREIAARVQRVIPAQGVLFRDHTTFIIWMPETSEITRAAISTRLHQALAEEALTLPTGMSILPRLAIATLAVERGQSAPVALRTLEQEIIQTPEFTAPPPTQLLPAISSHDALEQKLTAMQLFGRDGWVETILTALRLPRMQPATVLLLGAPQVGKSRLLHKLGAMLGGQHFPLAQHTCLPRDQSVPFHLLAICIEQLLAEQSPTTLHRHVAALCTDHPWLSGVFPALPAPATTSPPPDDPVLLRRDLASLLLLLARLGPSIVLLHDLQHADPESIAAFAALQDVTDHGLRVIASAAAREGDVAAILPAFQGAATTRLLLPSLSLEAVQQFLREATPDIAQLEVAVALFQETQGLPLAIESTLRAWVDDGRLARTAQGVWVYDPEMTTTGETGFTALDRQRLGMAALTESATVDLLCALWQISEEETRAVIDRGRALGYLRPIDIQQPDQVTFLDAEQAAVLLAQLSEEQRKTAHARIADLLEMRQDAPSATASRDLAYHFTQAGQGDRAAQYTQIVQLLLPSSVSSNDALPASGADVWDIPRGGVLSIDDLPLVIEAGMAIRLAGVQLRLYPLNSDIVRASTHGAISALAHLWERRPSLVISSDRQSIAFDGQLIQRRDLLLVMKDYLTWMEDAHIRAIGVKPGIREEELITFMQALTAVEPHEDETTIYARLREAACDHLQFLTRSFQHDLSSGGGGGSMRGDGGYGFPLAGGEALPSDVQFPIASAASQYETKMPDTPPAQSVALPPLIEALLHSAEGTVTTGPPGSPPADSANIDADSWARIPSMLLGAPISTRRTVMDNMVRLVRDPTTNVNALPDGFDVALTQQLQRETDPLIVRDTTAVVRQRLEGLAGHQQWNTMLRLLTPIHDRLQQEVDPAISQPLNDVLESAGQQAVVQGLLAQHDEPDRHDEARQMMQLLGGHAIHPLIAILKDSLSMQERARVMHLLREYGDMQIPLLLQELRAPNPWYVSRNLLQVLADVGNETALKEISEKITHPDPRVRGEAVNAAVRITRDAAAPYVLQGLRDESPEVRARTASLVGICPQPPILEQLLQMLQPPRLGKEEPEQVQLAACLALGHFPDDAAREALLLILFPRLFSSYRKKSDEIRSAAVAALATHLDHPAVQQAVKQATRDRVPIIRQTAQRIWQQYLIRTSPPPTS